MKIDVFSRFQLEYVYITTISSNILIFWLETRARTAVTAGIRMRPHPQYRIRIRIDYPHRSIYLLSVVTQYFRLKVFSSSTKHSFVAKYVKMIKSNSQYRFYR